MRISVRDDGVGGADVAAGSGLVGLKDRVEALGGRISIESPRGAGTSIEVELPLVDDERVGAVDLVFPSLNPRDPRTVGTHSGDEPLHREVIASGRDDSRGGAARPLVELFRVTKVLAKLVE